MSNSRSDVATDATSRASWIWLVLSAAAVGAGAGALGAAFRKALAAGQEWRDDLIGWADGAGVGGVLAVMAAVAVGVALSVWLVRRFAPQTAGSGIPDVERELLHEGPSSTTARVLPVKFIAGALSIGSGLTLGREGPTVQMGGVVGCLAGGISRRLPDPELLLAAGAGAGLAAAFNAPLAGAVFVVEELLHRFSTRLLAAALVASGTSIVVLQAWLGSDLDLPARGFQDQPASGLLAFAILGLIAGAVGLAFNQGLLRTLDGFESVRRVPPVALAGIAGAVVGLVAWRFPSVVGGGYPLAQEALTGNPALTSMGAILAGRFVLTLGSYGTGAAGGLFAPLLVIGAELGRIAGEIAHDAAPGAVPDPSALAVAGMAGVFVASVRAPLTGIVLILEMTGTFSLLLPVVVACGLAYVVPTAFGDKPVYDALRERRGATRTGGRGS